MLTSWTKALALATLSLASVSALSVDDRTDQILATMSVDHLVGQMGQLNLATFIVNGTLNETMVEEYAQFKLGSYFGSPFSSLPVGTPTGWGAAPWRKVLERVQEITMKMNGGHPILFGVDSVHGAVYTENATLFGQQINAGAAFNPELVYKMGEITAKDTVAGGTTWIFSPILEVSQNKMWSRTYETFGEDPHLVAVLGAAIIKGLQAKNDAAACMKHFVGYSKTPTGHDKDAVSMSDFELLNKFTPPFIAAVEAGVKTGMENYIAVNGEPVVSSAKLIRDLLRHDMGFEGFMVTDYFEIMSLNTYHHVAKTPQDAVAMVLEQTSIDMNMNSYGTDFVGFAKATLAKNPAIFERIKASARRIIKTKVELGLYDTPVPGEKYVASVGQAEDRQLALELARESIVLLQNKDKVLPLSEKAKVFLTGHSADNIGNQCGGWTWAPGDDTSGNTYFPNGVSIKQGLEKIAGADAISYFNGLNVTGNYTVADLAKAKELAGKAEYTIAVIGEGPYAEKAGDIENPFLPAGQIEYVKQLAATSTKVILVLIGGRPRLLDELPSNVHAVINGLLPCEAGGQAIAEIIYGKVNPSGRLPITYPKHPSGVDIQYNHVGSTQCTAGSFFTQECEMEWEFGTGLSYTTFTYTNMTLSKTNVTGESDSLTASVTVTNNGTRAGKETVMLFLTQPYRKLVEPEVKALKAFEKIELAPAESKTVSFTLTHKDWGVYKPQIGQGFLRVAEPGEFVVAFKPETKCDVYNATAVVDLCAKFNLN